MSLVRGHGDVQSADHWPSLEQRAARLRRQKRRCVETAADLDESDPPAPVARFRAALQACDGVLISSPEYAHGLSGVMKNALDWVVGSGELVDKPVALINAAPRATHAHAALMETLTVMSAQIVPAASITVPLQGSGLDASGIAADPALSAALGTAVGALASAARSTLARRSDPDGR